MKNIILLFVALPISLLSLPVFSQTDKEPEALGLPGDNLDLYAVLDVFQKSKTIEDFEKSLNQEKSGINNLDLDNDKKIDFIKVVTKKEGESFIFVLQDAISKMETQDVAVILVSKDKNKKLTIQIVGDKELYGKNYIVEPKESKSVTSTANPGYTGAQTVAGTIPTTTTVVAVESSPVVVYLYSPVYVPYVPPYYYGYYPPYFHPWAPIYFSMYYHNNYYHHSYYSNTVVIHNSNNYNHYSSSYRSSSTVVINNNKSGNYNGTYNGNYYNKPATYNGGGNNRPSTTTTKSTTRPATTTTHPSAPATPTAHPSTSSTRSSMSSRSGGGMRRR